MPLSSQTPFGSAPFPIGERAPPPLFRSSPVGFVFDSIPRTVSVSPLTITSYPSPHARFPERIFFLFCSDLPFCLMASFLPLIIKITWPLESLGRVDVSFSWRLSFSLRNLSPNIEPPPPTNVPSPIKEGDLFLAGPLLHFLQRP